MIANTTIRGTSACAPYRYVIFPLICLYIYTYTCKHIYMYIYLFI